VNSFTFIFGALGAWLLFIGPTRQAAIELMKEANEMSEIMKSIKSNARNIQIKRVSNFWWILPPVKIILTKINQRKQWDSVTENLSTGEFKSLSHFRTLASTWSCVAFGAWLIALKETFEMCEHFEFSMFIYIAIVAIVTTVSLFQFRQVMRNNANFKES
jgi:hypothetical protein